MFPFQVFRNMQDGRTIKATELLFILFYLQKHNVVCKLLKKYILSPSSKLSTSYGIVWKALQYYLRIGNWSIPVRENEQSNLHRYKVCRQVSHWATFFIEPSINIPDKRLVQRYALPISHQHNNPPESYWIVSQSCYMRTLHFQISFNNMKRSETDGL